MQVKTFALALGAGGARGLAHIAIVEALDEMGVKPVAIAGSSIGAVIGAGYAAGLTGRAMRRHLITLAHDRGEVLRRVMACARGRVVGNPGCRLRQSAGGRWRRSSTTRSSPSCCRETFADLAIPLTVIAADLHARERVVFTAGPLKPAVAASMAIPGLVRPIEADGRVLVDGGAVDPLPFEAPARQGRRHRRGRRLGRRAEAQGVPDPWEQPVRRRSP